MPQLSTIKQDRSRWQLAGEVDPLLVRARAALSDMVGYHNCDHAMLDRCCCVCESKRIIRDIEDREEGEG